MAARKLNTQFETFRSEVRVLSAILLIIRSATKKKNDLNDDLDENLPLDSFPKKQKKISEIVWNSYFYAFSRNLFFDFFFRKISVSILRTR